MVDFLWVPPCDNGLEWHTASGVTLLAAGCAAGKMYLTGRTVQCTAQVVVHWAIHDTIGDSEYCQPHKAGMLVWDRGMACQHMVGAGGVHCSRNTRELASCFCRLCW